MQRLPQTCNTVKLYLLYCTPFPYRTVNPHHCCLLSLKADTTTEYYFVPVLLSSIFAFFIAHCFLSVYEMTVDALLLCTCEAEKRQAVAGPLHGSMKVIIFSGAYSLYQNIYMGFESGPRVRWLPLLDVCRK